MIESRASVCVGPIPCSNGQDGFEHAHIVKCQVRNHVGKVPRRIKEVKHWTDGRDAVLKVSKIIALDGDGSRCVPCRGRKMRESLPSSNWVCVVEAGECDVAMLSSGSRRPA